MLRLLEKDNRYQSSIKARGGGVSGYFLAGRKMNWFLVGSSLFGSNIGSEHFIGLAGSGAATGIGIAGFEINALFVLVILGWIFLPVYIASGVYTMPEYLKKRFGGRRIRIYLASIALLLSIFTKISADLFAGAIFIKIALGWNLYWAILLQLSVACISTVSGGLRAVMWTDTCQVVIMVLGATCLAGISFHKIGGYLSLTEKYFLAIPNSTVVYSNVSSCAGVPPKDALVLLRSLDNPDLPWLGATLGLTINAIWYWCADQVIVQKALASKNYSHAKGGCILTAMYKLLPLWLLVFPGMISRTLFPDEIACTDPQMCEKICYSRNGCTNVAFPLLVTRLLPIGLKGIMIAVMMSAIMSSLSAIFNSSSSIFTIDIWTNLRKNPSTLELLIIGRKSIKGFTDSKTIKLGLINGVNELLGGFIMNLLTFNLGRSMRLFVIFMVLAAVLWIPIIASYPHSQLFVYVQSVSSYFAPPICATFLLAVLVPRVNEQGAFWGLMVGLVLGLARFAFEASYKAPACYEEDTRPSILNKVHYLHFGLLLFGTVCLVNLSVSFFTEKIDKEHLYRLTFWSRKSHKDRINLSHSDGAANRENKTGKTQEGLKSEIKSQSSITIFGTSVKKIFYFLCGLTEHSVDDENMAAESEDKISLDEKPFWRIATNIAGISVVSLALFIYCFWS